MEETQLVLMSNASSREFPDNKNSNFAIRLAKPLRIEPKKYKVGLVDAHYARTWTTEGGQRLLVTKLEVGHPQMDVSIHRFDAIVTLPTKRYGNAKQIVEALNSELSGTLLKGEPASKNVAFEYDKDSNEARGKLFSADGDETLKIAVGIEIYPGLAKLLGMRAGPNAKLLEEPEIVIRGKPPVRIEDLWSSLYIYCDLVEEYRVGDGLSSLLRILLRRIGADREVNEEPRNVQWLEAAARDSDIVRVNIRHDDGRLIAFDGGKVILTVRLKPD